MDNTHRPITPNASCAADKGGILVLSEGALAGFKANDDVRRCVRAHLATRKRLNSANAALRISNAQLGSLNEELRVTRLKLKRSLSREVEVRNAAAAEVSAELSASLAATGVPTVFCAASQPVMRFIAPVSPVYSLQPSDLRRILGGLLCFVGVCELDGSLVEINGLALHMAGLEADEVLGRRLHETPWFSYDRGVSEQVQGAVRDAADGATTRLDLKARMADEKEITFDLQFAPMPDAQGKAGHVVFSAVDISARLQLQHDLQASKDVLQMLLDSTGEAIFGVDLQGVCVFANPACARLLGKASSEQLLGTSMVSIFHRRQGSELVRHPECPVQKCCREGSAVHGDQEYLLRDDGSAFPVEYFAHPFFQEGRVAGAVVTFLDVTQRKQVERQQAGAVHTSAAANQAKSQFLTSMSHEIRSPMTAILGYAEILTSHLQDPDDRACVDVIRRNGLHMLDIINQVLDLSKIEAGKLVVESLPVFTETIVEDALLSIRVKAAGRNVGFTVEGQGLLPREFLGDPLRLRQVLQNLLDNALKFTEKGQIVLRIKMDEKLNLLCFEVEDTGVGMTPEQLTRLFQPFSQADASVARRYGGCGMGLAIAQQLVHLMGGTLEATSVLGKGSRFRFSVATGPLAGRARVHLAFKDSEMPAPKPPPERPSLNGSIVLVVDDRADMRRLLRRYLEKAGASVVLSEHGEAALSYLRANEIDLMVMDLQMPVLDGLQTARRVRQLGLKVPMLALTASAMVGDRERCLEAGCNSYLSKPIACEALIRAASELLRPKPLDLLLVEDNPMAAMAVRALLIGLGCKVHLANTGEQALAIAGRQHLDLMLLDLELPDLTGYELLDRMQLLLGNRVPPIVAHTGHHPSEVGSSPGGARFWDVLQKPSGSERLSCLLDRARREASCPPLQGSERYPGQKLLGA